MSDLKNLLDEIKNLRLDLEKDRRSQKVLTKYIRDWRRNQGQVIWGTLENFFGDLEIQRALNATRMSAELSLRDMNMARIFSGTRTMGFGYDRLSSSRLLEFAVKSIVPNDGLYLEFGVHSGESIKIIASLVPPGVLVYGFDSFEGLPEDWKADSLKGKFDLDGQLPEVPSNVKLHKGWFEDTLDDFLRKTPGKISFLNIDCDLYSSTQYVLETTRHRLQIGSVIHFDEYFNLPGWELYEYKAWQEFVLKYSIKYEYIGYTGNAYAVAVKITDLPEGGIK